MRQFKSIRAALVAAVTAQLLTASLVVTGASAQQQQPQYGEGPGVVTRTLPTTGKGDVQQPIYGEGPGVPGGKLPNTGDPALAETSQVGGSIWGMLVLIGGIASGLFAIMWARGRKLTGRATSQRVLIVTPGATSQS